MPLDEVDRTGQAAGPDLAQAGDAGPSNVILIAVGAAAAAILLAAGAWLVMRRLRW